MLIKIKLAVYHERDVILDFRLLFCCFDVQSDKFSRSIWTSACFPAALTSNLTSFLVQFGPLPAFSPQQRPIRTTFSTVLDFYRIPAASKSNLACFFAPFGLLPYPPPPQSPIPAINRWWKNCIFKSKK